MQFFYALLACQQQTWRQPMASLAFDSVEVDQLFPGPNGGQFVAPLPVLGTYLHYTHSCLQLSFWPLVAVGEPEVDLVDIFQSLAAPGLADSVAAAALPATAAHVAAQPSKAVPSAEAAPGPASPPASPEERKKPKPQGTTPAHLVSRALQPMQSSPH
jgi:hypothetical protein